MDSIIIPTRPTIDVTRGQKFHLLLSHELSPETVKFYREEARNGSYLILDNSAHERREGEDISTLLRQADELGAQEVVAPDVLFDKDMTLYRTRSSLSILRRQVEDGHYHRPIPRFMIVPQGATPDDYVECLWELVSFALKMPPDWQWTIGVSKDYNDYFPGRPNYLFEYLRDHVIPAARDLRAEIHLLGWPKPLPVLADLSREFFWDIRSTDSARPLTLTMSGIDLSQRVDVKYPGRPEGFFEQDVSDRDLLRKNIRIYRHLCRAGFMGGCRRD